MVKKTDGSGKWMTADGSSFTCHWKTKLYEFCAELWEMGMAASVWEGLIGPSLYQTSRCLTAFILILWTSAIWETEHNRQDNTESF